MVKRPRRVLTSQDKLDELRARVPCAALLDQAGYAIDVKESTRQAVKYRKEPGRIVIVIHEGRGWFDPLSAAKGDVFSLALHLGAVGFVAAVAQVGALIGYSPVEPAWARASRPSSVNPSFFDRWACRVPLSAGSP